MPGSAMCEIASAARVILRMTAKQPTKPAAAPAATESAMALGSKVMVNVVGDGSAVEFFKELGGENLPRDAEARVPARQAKHIGGVVIDDTQVVRDEQDGQAAFGTKTIERVVDGVLARLVHA